jgi:hypothetical protein
MDELARETWDQVLETDQLGARLGEVTITELLLIELKRFGKRRPLDFRICIDHVSQAVEARTGADFEIWVEVDRHRYFAYSIQAKRVRIADLSYPQLGHHGHEETPRDIAADPDSPRQYDTLIAHARAQGTMPIHLLYNGWESSTVKLREPPNRENYGCAIIPTSLLKSIREASRRRTNKVASYSDYLEPWSRLFRRFGGGGFPDNPRDPNAEYLGDAFNANGSNEIEHAWSMGEVEINPLFPDFGQLTIRSLPGYVEAAREVGGPITDDPTLPRYVVTIEAAPGLRDVDWF